MIKNSGLSLDDHQGETRCRGTFSASMDVEESIYAATPIDGVVLLMGCDKTTPFVPRDNH
jgi:hypothetical protein